MSLSSLKSNRVARLTSLYLATLLITSVCGTQYLFSAYSTALADKLGYSSVEINTIGSFANYGVYLTAPIHGYILDKYGSMKTTFVASFLVFLGYFCLAMTYSGYFRIHSFILCALYLFLAGAASSAGLLSCLRIIAKNFTSYRGIALGVPLSLFGLSAFTFAQIDSFFFKNDIYGFILFMSIATGSALFVGSLFLRDAPPPSTLDRDDEEIAVVRREERGQEHNETSPLLQSSSSSNVNVTGRRLLKNDNAVLLAGSMFFIGGIGLLYINNVGTIIKSLYYRPQHPSSHSKEIIQDLQNFHVSLISIFSCLGRLSSGTFSDVTKKLFNLRRLWYLIFSGFWLFIGNLMIAVYVKEIKDLWIASVFVGYGFGNLFGVGPTITSEWFGVDNFGLNWGILSIFPAFGGQLFNLLFGFNYDLHKNGCQGYNCYNTIFYFSALGCLASIYLLSILLYKRIKREHM